MASEDLQAFLDFAILLAREGGQLILEGSKARYASQGTVFWKAGNPADLVTETDKMIEEVVKKRLKERFPQHKFIGEETVSSGEDSALTDEPTWIVDPIDGTTNFVHGFQYVAISIALTINKEPVVGVVYNPFLDEIFTASKNSGAFLNLSTRLPLSHPHPPLPLPSSLSQCLVATEYGHCRTPHVIDRKVMSIHNMVARPGDNKWSESGKNAGLVHGVRSTGSAALNLCTAAKGQIDMYWEIGPWEWDVAAGVLILGESGGIVVDAYGPDEGPADILSRRFLAVRAGSPAPGDKTSRESQLRLVKEMWDVVEQVEVSRIEARL
ncbi:6572_t:CDS:2 [Paraglomus brasilianum]|uniref:Inositol-1-monophosphatase n=1 Tax=Paraglomus brasilianum TaxID=144538 RepID=A0A9N9FCL2_9GLOM|nr:6572_t:CDS:2 [Paraglomus brasilianum]